MRQRHAVPLKVIIDRRVKLAEKRDFMENLNRLILWYHAQGWRN